MNDKASTTEKHSENLPDIASLTRQWKSIDWKKIEKHVKRLQTRIAKATLEGNWNLVKRLTYLLTHSYYAKLLAVRKVTSNRGKRTAGIDGELWNTPSLKMRGALSLTDKHYHALPLKRVYIAKKGKKHEKRPLGIPTMYDRAMQALYASALSPVAETLADTHSFGFRLGRCAQDVLEYLFSVLSRKSAPVWILEGDIKGCFDGISHEWLKTHIPMDVSILSQFLKAGFIFEGKLFPTDKGTPQGGIISPILANMTLDGMQKLLEENLPKPKVHLARYADDFVVTLPTKEMAEKAKVLIQKFMAERGLELSEEKTHITHIDDGFDFLGWNFRRYNGTFIPKPSKKSIKNIVESLADTIKRKGQALTQDGLIKLLNPKIRGWTNYHKSSCAKEAFRNIDDTLYNHLIEWGKHRHNRKPVKFVANKYWHSKGTRNWVFSGETEELMKMSDVKIHRHKFLKLSMNPYLNEDYFRLRNSVS